MDAKHAWYFPAPRAGDNPETDFKIPGCETATGYLSRGKVFDVPTRR